MEAEPCSPNETETDNIITRQESESSGTATADSEFDDNVIVKEFDLCNDNGGLDDTQARAKVGEFVKPYLEMFPKPMIINEDDEPQRTYEWAHFANKEPLIFQPDVRIFSPQKCDQIDAKCDQTDAKCDTIDSSALMKLRPQVDASVCDSAVTNTSQYNAISPTQTYAFDQIQSIMEKSIQSKAQIQYCLFQNCTKKSSILCRTCDRAIYCTERHRKQAKQIHEMYCIAFRQIEQKGIGRHTIAARKINRTCEVLNDKPVIVLPLNPSYNSRIFPVGYCVRCFMKKVNSQVTGSEAKGGVDSCPFGCKLPICKSNCAPTFCQGYDNAEYETVSSHCDTECKYLSAAYMRSVGKRHFLIPDQSVLGLLRCMRICGGENISDEKTTFIELLGTIKQEPYTKNFESKLRLIRSLLLVDASVAKDNVLYKVDQALLRYGRNIGPDIVSYQVPANGNREMGQFAFVFVRCIFKKLAFVFHSCVPNCAVAVSKKLDIHMYAISDIKKGDILTYCYDERSVFLPTRDRRAFLLREFGYFCKCNRCSSASELETHFSSYICSRCNSYIVPDSPLDDYSNWRCKKCKKSSIFYLRVIDANFNFERELEKPIKGENPLGLLNVMGELVDQKYLHWNHHLIFHASIKLFNLLWEALNKNDFKVMAMYSKEKGLAFLKPAESIIGLSQIFLPHKYAMGQIIPLRLACLIKLRHLTNQLERKETTADKLNDAINEMYFRGIDMSRLALYQYAINEHCQSAYLGERNMQVLEMKVVNALAKVLSSVNESTKMKVTAFNKVQRDKMMDSAFLELMAKKETEPNIGIFPWDLDA